ncbi:MAG: Fic family protein [Candidatus Pseudobacter hemicellulosilyticus]|uniref:Fic family protein n=1 Tax=Candidatus Pseudobacter hemicellulosilyticus TaxID=3121375 RepID=A0AAJ5WTM8_9BACT|nr:MAG: Fic family protein [Pseudobacter sp.]
MEKNIPFHLQEIIFTDKAVSKQISRAVKEGKIKKIAPTIYTGKMEEEPEALIRRNLFTIIGHQYPGAVISHRSAFELKPTQTGDFFVTYSYTRNISLPGVTLHLLEGPGDIEGDRQFMGELYLGQQARAFLENLQVSRKGGSASKNLPREAIEEKLLAIISVNGEAALNQLRDQARRIAPALLLEKEFEQLNSMISALLATHSSSILTSSAAKAKAQGIPYDTARTTLLEQLFVELQQRTFKNRPDRNISNQSFANFAFFESYFSNYIEGTVFKVEEAEQIIETQNPLPARNEDSHDVLGTYNIVSSRQEMNIVPNSADHLLQILQYRHKVLLSTRSQKQPGQFKDRDNFAGQTSFVPHELVRGTLIKSFDYYKVINSAIGKALFMMFLISEVHPFLDGNGRIARVMMNAELVAAEESKIMIPTVYREDYIGALRRLTRRSDPVVYIRMMERAHEFSANVYGDNRKEMEAYLQSCNAFLEDTEGELLRIVPRNS